MQADVTISYKPESNMLLFAHSYPKEPSANYIDTIIISPDGKMNRNPTLKNLDKGYEFMPKYGKQVSAKQIIIPCLYRNYICFAKIDYN